MFAKPLLVAMVFFYMIRSSSAAYKQATKADILRRLQQRDKLHRHAPRASPLPCVAPSQHTDDGACCPPGKSYGTSCAGGGPTACCLTGVLYSPTVGLAGCCNGAIYNVVTVPFTTASCCPVGSTVTPDGYSCCTPPQVPIGNTCGFTRARLRARQPETDPSAFMLKRRDSPRTLLGPRLVADYLTNNGVFMYEGEKYVDVEHRTANENMLKRFMAKGLVGAMRWVHPTTQTLADVVDTLHYYPLSADYEFALADVGEIYARIVANPSFETFHWQAASFDRDLLRQLVSPHPKYNETLVEVFAQQYR